MLGAAGVVDVVEDFAGFVEEGVGVVGKGVVEEGVEVGLVSKGVLIGVVLAAKLKLHKQSPIKSEQFFKENILLLHSEGKGFIHMG